MPRRSATSGTPLTPTDEKVTINVGVVDLGQIDLLVQEGFYSNRSDFIRAAMRRQLADHGEVLRQVITRRTLVLGIQRYTAADLKTVVATGQRLRIRVLGLASIAEDVTPAMARSAIESLTVLGALHASADVKKALAGRIRYA